MKSKDLKKLEKLYEIEEAIIIENLNEPLALIQRFPLYFQSLKSATNFLNKIHNKWANDENINNKKFAFTSLIKKLDKLENEAWQTIQNSSDNTAKTKAMQIVKEVIDKKIQLQNLDSDQNLRVIQNQIINIPIENFSPEERIQYAESMKQKLIILEKHNINPLENN